jgi:hypothetical protein
VVGTRRAQRIFSYPTAFHYSFIPLIVSFLLLRRGDGSAGHNLQSSGLLGDRVGGKE